jgi:hypothetical protein
MSPDYYQALTDVIDDLKRACHEILADERIPDDSTKTISLVVLESVIRRVEELGRSAGLSTTLDRLS